MAVTVTNVLQSPADVYIGTTGATEPANADAVPGVPFTDAGATEGGTSVAINQTYSKMAVDQVALAVGAKLVTQELRAATTLAEATLANIRSAVNAASAAGTKLELDSDVTNAVPNYASVLIVGQRPGGGNRVVGLRRALSVENVSMPHQKDNKTVIPITWDAFYVSSSVKALFVDDTPGP
jgi:hypothetical protein